MREDFETRPADSAFHQRLPIGEVLDAGSLTEGDHATRRAPRGTLLRSDLVTEGSRPAASGQYPLTSASFVD